MTKKGLSPKSRKNIGGTLRTILGTAVEWEVIEKLPRFPRVKVPDAPWDFYTREESELLLSKTRSPAERALLLFPLHTGARAGSRSRSNGATSTGTTASSSSGGRRPSAGWDRPRAARTARSR